MWFHPSILTYELLKLGVIIKIFKRDFATFIKDIDIKGQELKTQLKIHGKNRIWHFGPIGQQRLMGRGISRDSDQNSDVDLLGLVIMRQKCSNSAWFFPNHFCEGPIPLRPKHTAPGEIEPKDFVSAAQLEVVRPLRHAQIVLS